MYQWKEGECNILKEVDFFFNIPNMFNLILIYYNYLIK